MASSQGNSHQKVGNYALMSLRMFLLTAETLLHVLCESIESGDLESGHWKRAAIAASAVWGLLHNCSRVSKDSDFIQL